MTPPTPKGHILFINRVFPPDAGASGLRLLELCQGLAEAGWAITVVTSRGRGGQPSNLHQNIEVIRLGLGAHERKPKFWEYPFWHLAFFFRALSVKKPDLVITLTDPPLMALVSAVLKKVRKIPAIHWVHDLYPDLLPAMGIRLPVIQPILMAISKWALNTHDKVVAIGEDMAEILRKDGIAADKISVILNWPDVSAALIDKRKPSRHDSQNPFVLEGCFTVLYSGNFGAVHDFSDLIEAIKIVHQSPHPIRFILAGDGPKFTSVRDKIEKMFLTNVHFIRAQPKEKFMDMLLAGDLHVATMIPESTGMVAPSKINSALGLGRPCLLIGSKKSTQAQLITSYKAGLVVDPTDEHARFQLAEAIIQYATDDAFYMAAQNNALRAAESISFDKAVGQFDVLATGVKQKS